jgi:polysaccharide chain length determinant protein (PEP-CTERM system associated)
MLGHRELTMRDYTDILKRRFWLIAASTILFLCAGVAICYFVPPQYVSETKVLIDPQKVPEDYVKPVDSEGLNARLASIEEQIKSRSRIEPIVERFNLFPGGKSAMDDRVDQTRQAIGIHIMRSDQSRGMPGFTITFKAHDAHTAQQVCGEITSQFISANLTAREQSSEGTTDFLKQQLVDAKRNLDDQDAKLAAFESKNIGRLPNQEPANANTLQALTAQLDVATQTVSRLQQDETFLEAMIAEKGPEAAHVDPATGASEDSLQTQLKDAVRQEKQFEAVYTSDHPDVVAMKRRVANLRTEIAHDAAEPAKSSTEVNSSDSPQLQQLKSQLRAGKQSLAAAKQNQARIEQQVRAYEAKIESSPMVEEEYKQVTRDHETALQFYNTLLTKMNESSMATALEHRQQGEQFRVMDAPNLPDEPTFPNRRVFAGGGLAFGLALGLLFAALLEYRDTSLRNESDIWAFTKLPTLAVVSYINELDQSRVLRVRGKLFSRKAKASESVRG